ncbi:MAG TPA: hypothetical protein PLK35_00505 [Candidatus Moranbacteria bacterium]|nr:hypothetical protein [Candidatus Moranbacteria bacterium]
MANLEGLTARTKEILGEAGRPHKEAEFYTAFCAAAREVNLENDSYKPYSRAVKKALQNEGFVVEKTKPVFSRKLLRSLIAQSRAHERKHLPYTED